ncbi:MAG: hypothetical protein JWQ98_1454 [Chlorobi bacterium]|jgi:hypothetical protein|nr:hypothetical protein [Chlorobiota bacterium]
MAERGNRGSKNGLSEKIGKTYKIPTDSPFPEAKSTKKNSDDPGFTPSEALR